MVVWRINYNIHCLLVAWFTINKLRVVSLCALFKIQAVIHQLRQMP